MKKVTTILLRNVPEEIKRKFKMLCAKRGTNMTQELLKFIRRSTEESKCSS